MSRLEYPIIIFYSEEDGRYIAVAPDRKGCSAFGETPQKALKEIETTIVLWLETARTYNDDIPEPTRMST